MWAVKIYALVWFLSATVAVGGYLMGFSGEMAQAILGMFFLTLVASGFVLVLPAWVDEYFEPKF